MEKTSVVAGHILVSHLFGFALLDHYLKLSEVLLILGDWEKRLIKYRKYVTVLSMNAMCYF